ncbi:prepilin-type N-terminal cleavage/methylation domain-containing protein [Limnohabitans sp. Rim47]|uniref:type IV pilus modification PilV family protein n=1 Tax=Limnohabitans sp. Rim47 TaxID=1100721 RepID=UPI0002EE2CC1|nr:prepilin-type N-terminal cleavage/methylation domain-containing protein [Limnohabitans sp. Rim47]
MTNHAPAQQGMALIEALIASAVLGIGLVGATQLTLKTLHMASASRQHTVAQHLAQEAMDCLRSQANATLCPGQDDMQLQGVRYTRQTRITPRGDGLVNDLQVSVEWVGSGTGTSNNAAQGSKASTRIEWHSSASTIPLWVGVSSP